MQVLTEPRSGYQENRGVNSILEIYNINTGERRVLAEFDDLIEAPNWKRTGNI